MPGTFTTVYLAAIGLDDRDRVPAAERARRVSATPADGFRRPVPARSRKADGGNTKGAPSISGERPSQTRTAQRATKSLRQAIETGDGS